MGPPEILRELEALARRLGVLVRFDPFDPKAGAGRGGLCRLRGEAVIVVDSGLPVLDKVSVVADALATFDLERVYVPPFLRGRLQPTTAAGARETGRPSLRKARVRPRATS